jgi:hypothetical protein
VVRTLLEDPNPGELGRRSFAWVDDEITDADRDWVSTHHHGQALLHHVQSFRGLTDEDYAALDKWLQAA